MMYFLERNIGKIALQECFPVSVASDRLLEFECNSVTSLILQ